MYISQGQHFLYFFKSYSFCVYISYIRILHYFCKGMKEFEEQNEMVWWIFTNSIYMTMGKKQYTCTCLSNI